MARTGGVATTVGAVLAGPLAEEHRRLVTAVVGRSLHLAPGDPAPSGGTFDTVVSAGWLPGQADLPAAIGRLAGLLAPGGRLLLLEPEVATGWRRMLAFAFPSRAEGHLDRDVSGAVWASGLRLTDAVHLVMPGQRRSLRHWLRAVACFPPTALLRATAAASMTTEEES